MTDINYFIKLFTEMLDDPDLGMLPDNLWRRLIELSLMAADYGQDGELPPARQIAWRLRYKPETLQSELDSLVDYGFLSKADNIYQVVEYEKLVKPIDAKIKSKQYRERKKREKEAEAQLDSDMDTRKPKVMKTSPKVTKSATELELDTDIDIDTNVVGEKPPPAVKPKTLLMSTFQTETGLKMPHKKNDIGFWWSNIHEIYKITDECYEEADQLIRQAVKKLKEDRLTIGGPESIVKTCRALYAERSNGSYGDKTGHHLTPAEVAAAKRLKELERSGAPSP